MSTAKKPFKLVEMPVNNFKEIAIPHHLKLLADHRDIVKKEHDDSTKMRHEAIGIKRLIAQLKGLLYELDTLRAQVEDTDLDKFDMQTVSLRKEILRIISEYTELLKETNSSTTNNPSPTKSKINYENDNCPLVQLQIDADLNELKLKQNENCLQRVENIETDIQDLHSVYCTLNNMVVEQQEAVNVVEENVEDANENVTTGARHILSASKLKASVYPVTGAIIGTCVGGPLGLIAGLKVGGAAALGCGLIGLMSGKYLKNKKIHEIEADNTNVQNLSQENDTANLKNEKQE